MALWSSNDFFASDCMSLVKLAEVVAICHQDGDIEHTQKKYLKMTHSCEKDWFALCVMRQQKVCNAAEINKVA